MAEPIFKKVFGKNFEYLPEVLRNHYLNRSNANDIVISEGKVTVDFTIFFYLFAFFFRYLKVLLPYKIKDAKALMIFRSEYDSYAFVIDRKFTFANDKKYNFLSKAFAIGGNQVFEIIKMNIGLRCAYFFRDNKIIIEHRGYSLWLFKTLIPLPLTLIFGKISAEEEALSQDQFATKIIVKHFLFGKIYEYRGEFKITKIIQ